MRSSERKASPPVPAVGTVEQVQALERRLIDEWGYPALVLMERAALCVAHFLQSQFPGAPVLVLIGTGNNAADGIAVARLLLDRGVIVRVLTVGSSLGELASKQMAWLTRRGLQPKTFAGAETFGSEWVVLDAVFGIGLNRVMKSDAQLAIDWINRGNWRSVVSVDLPSGLNGNTGEPLGGCVKADHTIAFGLLKTGLVMDPALQRIGRLWLADIGFPPGMLEPVTGHLNQPSPLPAPTPDAHKGSMGTVLVVAGSATMTGAAILAARAACRTGIGLVYLGVPAGQRAWVAMALPEAIVLPLPESEGGIGPECVNTLLPHLRRAKALLVGPGLGHTPRVTELVALLLETFAGPVVLDADALPRNLNPLAPRQGEVIMTPHAGEMGRIFSRNAEEIQGNRLHHALESARQLRAIMVFKGARTIIARPDGPFAINTTGTPMLATAGSGDVLAGLIVGLLARGLAGFEAACTAVYLHGLAAEAAKEAGMVSLVASDITERIPRLLGQAAHVRPAIGDVQQISS